MSMLDDLLNAGFETVRSAVPTASTPPIAPAATPAASNTPWYSDILNSLTSPTAMKIYGAAAPIVGGLVGNSMAKDDYAKAAQTQVDAANLAGTYQSLGPAAASLIQDNPELLAIRRQALQNMQNIAQTGTTPEDEALNRQHQAQVNQNFLARQQQLQDERNRRGVQAGSGLALAQSMGAVQGAQQNQSEFADADAIRKQQAKLAATQQLGNMASSAMQQDFSRDLDRASATDKFNLDNITNQMNAAKSKANLMGNVAASQAQQGQNSANLANTIGTGVSQLINQFNKK